MGCHRKEEEEKDPGKTTGTLHGVKGDTVSGEF